MLTINEILKNQEVFYKVYLIKKENGKRLNLGLNLSGFTNASFDTYFEDVNLNGIFTEKHLTMLNSIKNDHFNSFYFFQENSPLLLSMIKFLKKNDYGGTIELFQDGLKPYNPMKGLSLGMIKEDIKVWNWLKNNGLFEFKPFKIFITKKYAYLDEIDVVHLTFPESYHNWNKKKLIKIDFVSHEALKKTLEKVFCWKNDILEQNANIIFFMSQPMHHDAHVEIDFLKGISEKLNRKLVIKLHPLTSALHERVYIEKLVGVQLIKSEMPAELFIMNLQNSTIVSLNSTSMFYNTPTNKYFYVSNLFSEKINRLKRYAFKNSPSEHITMVNNIDEII